MIGQEVRCRSGRLILKVRYSSLVGEAASEASTLGLPMSSFSATGNRIVVI